MKMKKYIIDQALFLIPGIVIVILIPIFWGPIFTLILEIMTLLSWGYLCKHILLLPFDYFYGMVNRKAYFASQCNIMEYEFFKGKYSCEWKFIVDNDKKLYLVIPVAATKDELCLMEQPAKNKEIRITYLRFSKILISWEQVN